MSSFVGLSVGTSTVRVAVAETDVRDPTSPEFIDSTVETDQRDPLEAAVLVAKTNLRQHGPSTRIAIAVQNASQRGEIAQHLSAASLTEVLIVSATAAAMRCAGSVDEIRKADTVAVYDLGASRLWVTLVDNRRGHELGSALSTVVSGDQFDLMVQSHLVAENILTQPDSEDEMLEVTRFCRGIKESLSTSLVTQTPGGGTLLMERDQFERRIHLAVEESAKIISELGVRSKRHADAVVVIGGGANIPVIAHIIERWVRVPVVKTPSPETVVSRGASLLAASFGDGGSRSSSDQSSVTVTRGVTAPAGARG